MELFIVLVILMVPCTEKRGIYFYYSIVIFCFEFSYFLDGLNWCVLDEVLCIYVEARWM